jgi:hypothetical protein
MTLDFHLRRGDKLECLIDGEDIDGNIVKKGTIAFVDDLKVYLNPPPYNDFVLEVYCISINTTKPQFFQWILDSSSFKEVEK